MNDDRSTPSARDDVLGFLSPDERQALAAAPHHAFAAGDEFLDLEKLEEGVRIARGTGSPVEGLLPRSVVHELTWKKILGYLGTRRSRPPPSAR